MPVPRYPAPEDPEIAREVAALDADAREFFEERAAIRQYDGTQSRAEAEAEALTETRAYLARRNSVPQSPGAPDLQ